MTEDKKPSAGAESVSDKSEAEAAQAKAAQVEAVMTVSSEGDVTVPPPQPDAKADAHARASDETASEADVKPAAKAASTTGKAMPESSPHSAHVPAASPAPVVIKQSSGKGMALGALVLSLLALGASGFLFVEGQNVLKTQELSLSQKLDKAGLDDSKNALMLEGNSAKLLELNQSMADVQKELKAQGVELDGSRRAYQELVKSRADWVVDEAEASLNLAAQQLMISGNVPVAVAVLEGLESRLARFEQPQLLPIKQAISQDLAALKSKPYLDVASASLRLNRLEMAVSSLPLAADSTLQPGAQPPEAAVDEANASWWQKSWQKTVNSLKGMVEVRHINSNDSMLMSPEQLYFVRENLRLRVMDARLALMQRSGEVYMSDLNSAEAAIKQYFDVSSASTQSWLNELAQLKTLDVQSSQDGQILAASLAAVREYQQQVNNEMISALPDLSASAAAASAIATPAPNDAPAASEPAAAAQPSGASEANNGGRAL